MFQVSGINPWLAMWKDPRATVRVLVSHQSTYGILYLATIYALQAFFFCANWWSLGLYAHYYTLLLFGIFLSPLAGFVWLYFMGFIFHITSRRKATSSAFPLRILIAWSKIPCSLALLMWLFLIVLNPSEVFIQEGEGPSSIFINLITLTLGIWSWVLLIQGLREVQQCTLARCIVNAFFAWSCSSLLLFVLFGFFRYIYLNYI